MGRPRRSNRRASLLLGLVVLGLGMFEGCARQPAESPDERLRRQAAEDARQVHHDVQAAGVEARKALGNAGRETRDIVAGAREGWREGAPAAKLGAGALDINSASAAELAAVPGISASAAHRIAAGRPYKGTRELVGRGILTWDQFDRVQRRIAAR